jgi:hypothetical protein
MLPFCTCHARFYSDSKASRVTHDTDGGGDVPRAPPPWSEANARLPRWKIPLSLADEQDIKLDFIDPA